MEFYSLRQDEAVRALTKKVDPLNFPAEFTVDEYTECTNATVEDSIPLSTFKSQTSGKVFHDFLNFCDFLTSLNRMRLDGDRFYIEFPDKV